MNTAHISSQFVAFLIAGCLNAASAGTPTPEEEFHDRARSEKVDDMYARYKKKAFPEVQDVSAEQVLERMEREDVIFVDVRRPEEQDVSMLPGAITDEEFLENPEEYREHLVIGYCTVSYRSGKLLQDLQKKGIPIFNLRGGILAWLHAGGKVYKDGRSVKKVHVYGKKWDLAPSSYESVW